MQNITLYIGDNATGKTRRLESICKTHKYCVNNLEKYKSQRGIELDNNKVQALLDDDEYSYNNLRHSEKRNSIDAKYINELLDMICSKGDVLIIDELDANLSLSDMMDITHAINTVRPYWKAIYVSGYNGDLRSIFNDTSEDGTQVYNPNIHTIDEHDNDIELTEEQACEYIDSF
ncbi:MAG: hypothetical protein NC548_50950 [Lachnospiraceae bacterium]|nr:hypothetical protein [Lachnospiraceae bacterium]